VACLAQFSPGIDARGREENQEQATLRSAGVRCVPGGATPPARSRREAGAIERSLGWPKKRAVRPKRPAERELVAHHLPLTGHGSLTGSPPSTAAWRGEKRRYAALSQFSPRHAAVDGEENQEQATLRSAGVRNDPGGATPPARSRREAGAGELSLGRAVEAWHVCHNSCHAPAARKRGVMGAGRGQKPGAATAGRGGDEQGGRAVVAMGFGRARSAGRARVRVASPSPHGAR
jgi:hypothetical protein